MQCKKLQYIMKEKVGSQMWPAIKKLAQRNNSYYSILLQIHILHNASFKMIYDMRVYSLFCPAKFNILCWFSFALYCTAKYLTGYISVYRSAILHSLCGNRSQIYKALSPANKCGLSWSLLPKFHKK